MAKRDKLNCLLAVIIFMLITVINIQAQETYPARVVSGPNFASDLFYANSTQRLIKSKVQHLHSLDIKFGLANWYWTTSPTVASATTSINVELNIDNVGFVMNLPNGGQRQVTLEEAGISAAGYSISDIQVDIEFGKAGARATASLAVQAAKYGQVKKSNLGGIRFNSDQDRDLFNKFIKENKLNTVKDIFSSLDPQVSITNLGQWAEYSFVLERINTYIQKVWAEGSAKIKFDNIVAEAQHAESFGRIDEALPKYEEAYKIVQDPTIKAKIDELKSKKKEQEDQELSNVPKKQQMGENSQGTTAVSDDDIKESNKQADGGTTIQSNGSQQPQELDFFGNPITKNTASKEVETVSYGGMAVENNENYRSQMELRERDATSRRAWDAEQEAKRQRIGEQNDAIVQQAQRDIERTDREIAEMDRAIGQLDVSSGKNLLESSSNLARAASITGNVGQAKGALVGMGVGAVMAIGEGAAKRRAAREAREEREKLEKERVAKLKTALRNARTAVLSYFEAGELPISSTRTTGNNLYYFVYAMDRNQIEENSCQIYASNVFAIGRYPDGTWPMKTKVEQELNALTSSEETIHGPYSSLNEAQNSLAQFVQYAEKARMEVAYVEHKGFNAQVEGSRQSTGPALDFFGNPINQNPKKNQSTQKEKATPTKTSPKLDFFGNPIKE